MVSPHLYRRSAPAGLDAKTIDRAIELTDTQIASGVTPILTLKHLALLADVKVSFLEQVVSRNLDAYSVYAVRKRNGASKRQIAAPHPELYKVQRWLLDRVFALVSPHDAAHAYTKGRSAASAARRHLGATWLIKADVRDFFHQFDESQVFELLAVMSRQVVESADGRGSDSGVLPVVIVEVQPTG